MTSGLAANLAHELQALDARRPEYVVELVDLLIDRAITAGASDLHLQPTEQGLEARWRLDGVLHQVATLPRSIAPNVAARLKVMSQLLTYRTDVPQEGRVCGPASSPVERRVSTFPTLHGERVVVRLFASTGRYSRLADLGLPPEIHDALESICQETSGAVVIAGPAGSGKTTTLYASLRAILEHARGARSVVSLEDPIEVEVPGVAQSQVNTRAGFDLARGLRSLMRQDPEVIGIGEIRDPESAGIAFEAALTGQLVLTTFHAGSACEAVSRLLDMQVEPYVLRSGLRAVLYQRLARALCPACSRPLTGPDPFLGLPARQARGPVGCAACHQSGYNGRLVLCEWLDLASERVAAAVRQRVDTGSLEPIARAAGMRSRWERAVEAIEAGATSPEEVRRVFGLSWPGTANAS